MAVITIFPESLDTIGRIRRHTNGDILNGRGVLWKYALDMFEENPLLGKGYVAYTKYCATQGFEWDFLAHNIYIELLGEVGIIGTIMFLTFFINTFIKTIKIIKFERENENINIIYFSLFIQIVFLVYGLTGNPLYYPQQMIIYMISVAIISNNITNKIIRSKENVKD